MRNGLTFVKVTDKGTVMMEYTKWGVSYFIIDGQGNTVDSWDGKLVDLPARFK